MKNFFKQLWKKFPLTIILYLIISSYICYLYLPIAIKYFIECLTKIINYGKF